VGLFSDRGDFRGDIFCWPNRAGSALAGPLFPPNDGKEADFRH
jgi:hypothetical protein